MENKSEDIFGGLTVGQVIGKWGRVQPDQNMGLLAQGLLKTGCTAMAVAEDSGKVVGMVTQNDIMRAYFEGTPPTKSVREWLSSGVARAPTSLLEQITVKPAEPLVKVAERMVANNVAGDRACHHVVVQQEDGQLYGVISSHDLIKFLCGPDSVMWTHQPSLSDIFAPPDALEAIESLTVVDIMKHKDRVFTCSPTNTIKDVLKVLLVTQQNSTLIMDEYGLHGIITPRDAIRAFANATDSQSLASDWLSSSQMTDVSHRIIESDAKLADAANQMTEQEVDHLIVARKGTSQVVGVVSSLDIVLRTKARTPMLRSMPLWHSPSVGDILSQHLHLMEVCPPGTTLGGAATVLNTLHRTSTLVAVDSSTENPLALLTENDILRAYINGWPRTAAVEGWLTATEMTRAAVPLHLQVPPLMPITDAASLMLSAAEPGRTCHHLVVKAVTGGWLGVFSSLDVARALHGLCTELDKARSGVDQTLVDVVMKPISTVPTCKPNDSIRDALGTLDIFEQNAALVFGGKGEYYGMITPRCALQALTEAVPLDRDVATWIRSRRAADGPREIVLGTRFLDAADTMVTHNLHHLVVLDAHGGKPAGVLSSLDVVRGVASLNYSCPFASLAWLRTLRDPAPFSLQAPHFDNSKRPEGSEQQGSKGSAKVPRLEHAALGAA